MEILQALKDAREQSGLKQRQVSEMTGISQSTIARLETFTHIPRVDTVQTILNALGYRLAVVKIEEDKPCA